MKQKTRRETSDQAVATTGLEHDPGSARALERRNPPQRGAARCRAGMCGGRNRNSDGRCVGRGASEPASDVASGAGRQEEERVLSGMRTASIPGFFFSGFMKPVCFSFWARVSTLKDNLRENWMKKPITSYSSKIIG